jgi:hypothetical protein
MAMYLIHIALPICIAPLPMAVPIFVSMALTIAVTLAMIGVYFALPVCGFHLFLLQSCGNLFGL